MRTLPALWIKRRIGDKASHEDKNRDAVREQAARAESGAEQQKKKSWSEESEVVLQSGVVSLRRVARVRLTSQSQLKPADLNASTHQPTAPVGIQF